jgi:hypothetical protein
MYTMSPNAHDAYVFCYNMGKRVAHRHITHTILCSDIVQFIAILRQCRPIERQAYYAGLADYSI